MYDFLLITPTESDWTVIESTYDGTIYKTKAWFDYLIYQHCTPFIIKIFKKKNLIGYFVGERIKRGVWIIGSPFEGIGTGSQGISMLYPVDASIRIAIYKELSKWIFKNRYAVWIQIEDWQLTMEDLAKSDLTYEGHDSSWIDLTTDEETLFSQMDKKSCRYKIRKAQKEGVIIRETSNPEQFLDEHFNQCLSVMHGKGLEPLRPKEHFREMIRILYPQYLILLEAVIPNGTIISTGIYATNDKSACSFSSASYREYSSYCANELIRWEALLRCKARGASIFNNNGVMPFKLKFGALRDYRPRIIFSRYHWLSPIRQFFKDVYHKFRFTIDNFIR